MYKLMNANGKARTATSLRDTHMVLPRDKNGKPIHVDVVVIFDNQQYQVAGISESTVCLLDYILDEKHIKEVLAYKCELVDEEEL